MFFQYILLRNHKKFIENTNKIGSEKKKPIVLLSDYRYMKIFLKKSIKNAFFHKLLFFHEYIKYTDNDNDADISLPLKVSEVNEKYTGSCARRRRGSLLTVRDPFIFEQMKKRPQFTEVSKTI